MTVEAKSSLRMAALYAAYREEHSRSALSSVFRRLYRLKHLRPLVRAVVLRLEGGMMFSRTLRDILNEQYGVQVGMYSYGPCLIPGSLPRGTVIGNFCSIAGELQVFRRNHPAERLSMHPFFYNHHCGFLSEDSIAWDEDNPLHIGHDVWIGARTTILPRCRFIGTGAIIGAGSVVTKDVEPFAVLAGNPARFIKKRFSDQMIEELLESEWWNKPLARLVEDLDLFLVAVNSEVLARLRAAWPGAPPANT